MKILDFSNDDLNFAYLEADKGKRLIESFNIDSGAAAVMLDIAFFKFIKSDKRAYYSDEDIACMFGYLFGKILRDDFSLSWKYIEDEYGKEPALIDPENGSSIFPVNAVWKRLDPESEAEPFFENIYETFKKHINSLSKTDDK